MSKEKPKNLETGKDRLPVMPPSKRTGNQPKNSKYIDIEIAYSIHRIDDDGFYRIVEEIVEKGVMYVD